jgi:hypothetical protein
MVVLLIFFGLYFGGFGLCRIDQFMVVVLMLFWGGGAGGIEGVWYIVENFSSLSLLFVFLFFKNVVGCCFVFWAEFIIIMWWRKIIMPLLQRTMGSGMSSMSLVLINLAATMERADESLLPAVYKEVSEAFRVLRSWVC